MGLEGQLVDCPPSATGGRGACPDAGRAGDHLARAVTTASSRSASAPSLPDGLELCRHVRVLARDGGDDPSVLAVRAVELLRDLRLTAQRRPRGPAVAGARRRGAEAAAAARPFPPRLAPLGRRGRCSASPQGDQPGVGPAFGPAIAAGAVFGPQPEHRRRASPDRSIASSAPSTRGPRRCSRPSRRWSSASACSPLGSARTVHRRAHRGQLSARPTSPSTPHGSSPRTPPPGCRCSAWAVGLSWRFREAFHASAGGGGLRDPPNMLVLHRRQLVGRQHRRALDPAQLERGPHAPRAACTERSAPVGAQGTFIWNATQ